MLRRVLYAIWAIFLVIFLYQNYLVDTNKIIAQKTDEWIHAVTVANNPQKVYSTFCGNGILWGTLSDQLKKGSAIKEYFEFFAKLPNIQVVKKEYNIDKIDNNVYVNNAIIHWLYDDLPEPLIARMTFIFKRTWMDWCIFELHSSQMPDGI